MGFLRVTGKKLLYTRDFANISTTVGELSLDGDSNTDIRAAEKECLEARATYLLRNSIVENVLVVDPHLKAVHSGINATPAERWNLPSTCVSSPLTGG